MVIGGVLALIVAVVAGLSLMPGPLTRRITDPPAAGPDPMAGGPYIGSRACRGCHPGESVLHGRSGHARTLRAAEGVPLARELDGRVVPDPERPGVTWAYTLRDGRLHLERAEAQGGAAERFLLDYAFGSGRHATTFVTVLEPGTPAALEHRLTHFTREDALGLTPGQESGRLATGTTPLGRTLSPRATAKCFECHTTRVSEGRGGLDADALVPNVACERCHGPARTHVEAARAGRTDLTMPFGLDGWTSASQLGLCAQCHRPPFDIPPEQLRPENPELARFQPIGLMASACYTQSRGALSCVTCHDPHGRASTERASYVSACLKCHQTAPQVACPVSPGGDCIDCHMPKVDSGQHVLFTDHWIRPKPSMRPAP